MRRFTLILAIILTLFIITSCSETTSTTNNADLEEQYYNIAMEYVNKGDIDTAIAALEEGISVTQSERLVKLLEEIQSDTIVPEQPDVSEQPNTSEESDVSEQPEAPEESNTPQEPNKTDYSKYVGTWLSQDCKLIVSMTDENTLYVKCDSSWSDSFEKYINILEIADNKYSTEYYDLFVAANIKLEISFEEDVIIWGTKFSNDTSGEYELEYFEKYIPSNATLDIKDYFPNFVNNNYSAYLYSSNDSIELYVEAEILNIDLKLNNEQIYITYIKKLGQFNGTDIKLTPDEKGGNSLSFNIQKMNDGYYMAHPFGTDGKVTLTFDGANISYKLTDCSFATDKTEDILSSSSFSWADMSGLYYDENEGAGVWIHINYDENTDTYIATFDGSTIDFVSINGYTLSGMISNADITLTYDRNTELVTYSYFDYTSRQSYAASLYRIAS